MVDILSLPRRPTKKFAHLKNLGFDTGLPINSLPGWEHIPLNSKLPMLKCPDNQVIFSKNKIGQSFRHLKQDFDPSGVSGFPEYNPLHDSNLKTFYSNERNLKRLRENGEITMNNDVICNLKDFNEYRQQLHKSQLYYILQELNRLEAEQRDRMLIGNAEAITHRDHRNIAARQHNHGGILLRKEQRDNARKEKFILSLQRTEENFERIAAMAEMQKALIEHKKLLNQLKLQHHWDVSNDLTRKRLIMHKKLSQFKKERLKKNLRILRETRIKNAQERQSASWNKRLTERIESQERVMELLKEVAEQRQIFIANHRKKYQQKWEKIQEEIKRRARGIKRLKKKRKVRLVGKRKAETEEAERTKRGSCPEYQEIFEQLVEAELCEALNTAIDMETKPKITFDPDDPIYKAAKFIMQNVIATYDQDLSDDKITCQCVAGRIDKFFDEAKKFVMFRASQIIASAREIMKLNPESPRISGTRHPSLARVTFTKFSNTIGTSSYEIHPLIDLRHVNDRTPTPAGSLASVVIDSSESLVNKIKTDHLSRNDMVFIEHYIVKFKRELIVGMGKQVFSAIRCHFENKIMDVRRELLEIDRKFLIKQATHSILSYAINPINYETSLKICISALSSDIIWALQKNLMRPTRDPRVIVPPSLCCKNDNGRMKLCLYCH